MTIIEILSLMNTAGRVLAVILFLCYLYQVVYLFVPLFKKYRIKNPPKPNKYAILVAARNEENVIPYLLDSISAQDYNKELFDVFVIADNCSDKTADVAREHGAKVYERFNTEKVGKGYAVNFLLSCMENDGLTDSYDAFLIFDADNLLSENYITEINKIFSDGYQAVCGYRNSKNPMTNSISAGYSYWYLHDSSHLNASRMALGTTCAVTGTGFGFTRELYRKMGGWNFFTLTEDIEFNSWCAAEGVKIGYCESAVLYDEQPETFAQSWNQRKRWVQGGLQVSLKYGWRLFCGMFRGFGRAWGCFETLTLSLWGYLFSIFVSLIPIVTIIIPKHYDLLLRSGIISVVGMYLFMALSSLMTVFMNHNKVPGSLSKKIIYIFTYPLFMFTYIPIAVCAIFSKSQWNPIEHKVTISIDKLKGKNKAKEYADS